MKSGIIEIIGIMSIRDRYQKYHNTCIETNI